MVHCVIMMPKFLFLRLVATRIHLFAYCKAFFTLGVLMIGTSKAPNSLSSECVNSLPSDWLSSYSSILAFPLSIFGLDWDVLWLLEGFWGPLSWVMIGMPQLIVLLYLMVGGDRFGRSWLRLPSRRVESFVPFCLFLSGMCTYAIELNILTWDRSNFSP